MAAADRKISEAEKHLALAAKYMKTSFFKWKPDYDSAVSEYGKAATDFRNGKAYDKAIAAYKQCAEVQKEMKSLFHAAKSLEQAGMLCKETKDMDGAAELMERASNLFLQSGTPDTAAMCLEKAAKMVESTHPDRAVHLLTRAVDVVDTEDRPKQAADLIRQAGRLLIRTKRLDDAVSMMQKEIEYNAQSENYAVLSKIVSGLVLVHLTRSDYVAADQCFQNALRNYPDFLGTSEAAVLEKLLEVYDEADQETAEQLLSQPTFKYLDNEFARLARDLKIPGAAKSTRTYQKHTDSNTDSHIDSHIDSHTTGDNDDNPNGNDAVEDEGLC